jgi:hypothetical protein
VPLRWVTQRPSHHGVPVVQHRIRRAHAGVAPGRPGPGPSSVSRRCRRPVAAGRAAAGKTRSCPSSSTRRSTGRLVRTSWRLRPCAAASACALLSARSPSASQNVTSPASSRQRGFDRVVSITIASTRWWADSRSSSPVTRTWARGRSTETASGVTGTEPIGGAGATTVLPVRWAHRARVLGSHHVTAGAAERAFRLDADRNCAGTLRTRVPPVPRRVGRAPAVLSCRRSRPGRKPRSRRSPCPRARRPRASGPDSSRRRPRGCHPA